MIKFPSELTIAQVDEYKVSILSEIDELEVIELDDSDLERIDTIGVQFILAVVTYIHAQGKQLEWSSSSIAFMTLLCSMLIEPCLGRRLN